MTIILSVIIAALLIAFAVHIKQCNTITEDEKCQQAFANAIRFYASTLRRQKHHEPGAN